MNYYWVMYVRLQRALRDLEAVKQNILPRLERLRSSLNYGGDIAASYEAQSIQNYLQRLVADCDAEIRNQRYMVGKMYGVPAPRTTPLLATDGRTQSS